MKRKSGPRRRARANDEKSFVSPSLSELGLYDTPNRIPEPGFGAYDKYIKAYADEVWVYACVSRLASDVAATPIHLYDRVSGKKVEAHPILELLAKPNSRMGLTRRGLMSWIEMSLLLTGNFYSLFDEVDRRGLPTTLWPLIPSLVEVKPSKDPKVFRDGYMYHAGGQPIPYGVEQVKQAMFLNPSNYHYGLSPIAAARAGIDTHRASTRYNLRFFDNGARPDLVFSTPHSLSVEQRKRMFVSWMKRHRGEDKAHLPAFLEKGTEPHLIGVNQKDMDFVLQKKMSREEICSTFKVPPALVGLFEYANYANAAEQERIYWRSTVVPDAGLICEFFNLNLLPLFERSGRLEFRVDETAIRALQEDEAERSQYIDRYWKMGVPLNTLVKAYKLPFGEVPGVGDRSFLALGTVDAESVGTTPVNEPAAVPGQLPPPKPAPKPADEPADKDEEDESKAAPKPRHPTPAQLKEKHGRMLLMADSLGQPLRVAVRKVFEDQRDAVLRAVHETGGKEPSREKLGIDTERSLKQLAEAMAPHVKIGVYAGRDAETMVVRDLTGKDCPKPSKKAAPRIDKWVDKKVFAWAGDINAATLKRVDKVIADSLSEGGSIDDLSRALADAFDTERDFRTLRVAQTEMIAALNEGALEAYRENPFVEGKGWLATEDEVTRLSHLKAGVDYGPDNPIGVDENFKIGNASGSAPGQTGDPSEDINCRCSVFPVAKKES